METEVLAAYCESPIGALAITGTLEGILAIQFLDAMPPALTEPPVCLQPCLAQLEEYFTGQRRDFSVALQLRGTDFQRRVWEALLTIPFGATVTYRDIAARLGNPQAVRAVGAANGQNPIPILVPCHRVIGSDGDLTGYGGGLWRKQWLLEHEGYPVQRRLFA
jgi:methylated-DNA-[protein]-cysteine S-methyltransferase